MRSKEKEALNITSPFLFCAYFLFDRSWNIRYIPSAINIRPTSICSHLLLSLYTKFKLPSYGVYFERGKEKRDCINPSEV